MFQYLPALIILISLFFCCSLTTFVLVTLSIFVGIPLLVRYSFPIQKNILFLNYVNLQVRHNFTNFISYGLPKDSENHKISIENGSVQLGLWYMPSTNKSHTRTIIYAHGNSNNRAASHRIEIYKKLLTTFDVIAFDYRGYGDSTNEPSEAGVVRDMLAVIRWTKARFSNPERKLYVWGHSLGTAIAIESLDVLQDEIAIESVILEAPFNNLADEIAEYSLVILFRFLPWFRWCFVEPLYANHLRFETDKHILKIRQPVLILHAFDDFTVPINLGIRLFNVSSTRSFESARTQMIQFNSKLGFGHNKIYMFTKLMFHVRNFIENRNTNNIIYIHEDEHDD